MHLCLSDDATDSVSMTITSALDDCDNNLNDDLKDALDLQVRECGLNKDVVI